MKKATSLGVYAVLSNGGRRLDKRIKIRSSAPPPHRVATGPRRWVWHVQNMGKTAACSKARRQVTRASARHTKSLVATGGAALAAASVQELALLHVVNDLLQQPRGILWQQEPRSDKIRRRPG